jgi:predicted membrane protein
MNNRNIAGIITAVIGLSAVMAFFNAGMSVPIISWPLEAYLGVAFTIAWLTSMPSWLAYLLAALFFILIALALYNIGSKVYGLIAGRIKK